MKTILNPYFKATLCLLSLVGFLSSCLPTEEAVELSSSRREECRDSHFTPIKLASDAKYAVCAVDADGVSKCWGSGTYGALGLESIEHKGDDASEMGECLPTVDVSSVGVITQIATFTHRTCALLDNNELKCWGYNEYGQLGYGDTLNRGDQAGEMRDNLPSINLGTGLYATQFSLSSFSTCALLNNGLIKCWGLFGNGDTGLKIGNQPNEMGDNLAAINIGAGRTAKQLAAGNNEFCAIRDDDSLFCWGWSDTGVFQNSGSSWVPRGAYTLPPGRTAKNVHVGGASACVVMDNDQAICFGLNEWGTLGAENSTHITTTNLSAATQVNLGTGRSIKKLSAGHFHYCAILDNDHLKCWGSNSAGELGYEDTNNRGDQVGEMGDNLPSVNFGLQLINDVVAGSGFTCALLHNQKVKCWGANANGTIRSEYPNWNWGDEPGEIGPLLPDISL